MIVSDKVMPNSSFSACCYVGIAARTQSAGRLAQPHALWAAAGAGCAVDARAHGAAAARSACGRAARRQGPVLSCLCFSSDNASSAKFANPGLGTSETTLMVSWTALGVWQIDLSGGTDGRTRAARSSLRESADASLIRDAWGVPRVRNATFASLSRARRRPLTPASSCPPTARRLRSSCCSNRWSPADVHPARRRNPRQHPPAQPAHSVPPREVLRCQEGRWRDGCCDGASKSSWAA